MLLQHLMSFVKKEDMYQQLSFQMNQVVYKIIVYKIKKFFFCFLELENRLGFFFLLSKI